MTERRLWLEFVLSEEYRDAVAEAIVQWAYFESEFDGLLALLRSDPRTADLTSVTPFSFKKRVNLFKDCSHICFHECPPLLDRAAKLRSDAKTLKRTRDHIAHCRWAGDPGEGHLAAYIIKNGKLEEREITVKELRDLSMDISELTRRTMAISHGGTPFRDHGFPLAEEEESFLRDFRAHSLPKPPTLHRL